MVQSSSWGWVSYHIQTECRTELKSQLDDHILTKCRNSGKKQSSVLSWEQHSSPKEFVTLTAHGPSNLSLILLRAAFWEYLHTCHCFRFLYPTYSCIIVFDVLFFSLKIICIWLLWGHVLLRVRLINTIPNSKGINFSLHYHTIRQVVFKSQSPEVLYICLILLSGCLSGSIFPMLCGSEHCWAELVSYHSILMLQQML